MDRVSVKAICSVEHCDRNRYSKGDHSAFILLSNIMIPERRMGGVAVYTQLIISRHHMK